ISEVCIRRNSVPIQSTPIRPVPSAEGIYKVRRGSYRPIASTRLTRIQLSGRLVNSCSFRGCSGAGRPSSGGAPVSTGICDKQGKKRSVRTANYAFSRHGSRLHLHGGQAVSRTNKCHQKMRAPVPTGTVSLVAVLPTAVRNDGVSRHHTPAGDVAYAAIPNMVPVYEAQRSHRQAPQSSGVLQMQESPGDLEDPLFLAASGTMGIVSRRVVVTTDASTKGWGAVCEGRGVNSLWSVTEAASHINVLELRTVVLAL